jgi:hypothetical protein
MQLKRAVNGVKMINQKEKKEVLFSFTLRRWQNGDRERIRRGLSFFRALIIPGK